MKRRAVPHIVSNQPYRNTTVSELTFMIVSHNSAGTLERAIESCLTAIHTCFPKTGKVVVLDNASSDCSPKIIDSYAERHSEFFVGVKGTTNIGFARANNRIAEWFPSKTYALVNPDVVFAPETIRRLYTTLHAEEDVAVVCPKLLYPDQTVQPSVRQFPTLAYFLLRDLFGQKIQERLYPFQYHYADLQTLEKPFEVDWGIGAFMLVSGAYAARHGLFDERYFLYFEDVNLCCEAWENGFRVLLDPQAVATHNYRRASTRGGLNHLRLLHMLSAFKFFLRHGELWL